MLAGLFFAVNAQATTWTDDPVVAGQTAVKGTHVSELKGAIEAKYLDAACVAAAGGTLTPWVWQSGVFPTGGNYSNTLPLSAQFVQMRMAVRNLYQLTATAPFCSTAPSVCETNTTIQHTPMRADHINDLRAALDNPALCVGGGSCNNDTIQNNGETGIDCGGGGCPACAGPCHTQLGDMVCAMGEYCCIDPGGVPDPGNPPNTYDICAGNCPTCSTGIQDYTETGVDCGGLYCPACASTGSLVLGNAHFSGTPVWGDWKNLDTNQVYHVVTVGSPGGGLEVVPFGNYEWLGGDVVSEVGCPVPGDPPDITPPIGTTQTIDAGTPDFGATVGCH